MICTAARFENREVALAARRELKRRWNIASVSISCEQCAGMHLRANVSRLNLPPRAVKIIRLLALGHTAREIAEELTIAPRTVEFAVYRLHNAFGALNSTHLIAIAIALDIVDPREFVPAITERDHDHAGPSDLQRRSLQREGTRSLRDDYGANAGTPESDNVEPGTATRSSCYG
jgi:LuxR family transcriptional regulator, transcriptional regulator of spore coat protein